MADKPNILFFFTDDQRFDTLAAMGHPQIRTPSLDKLAARGTVFTHATIMGGSSPAVCMPSRAMVHTGRTLYRLKNNGRAVPEDHTMLGEHLQASGYRTFGTGKWHQATRDYARCFTDGEEIFFGGMTDHWNMPAYHFDPSGKYDKTLPQCKDTWSTNELIERRCEYIRAGEHSTDILAEATANFIEDSGDRPFFAYVSFLAPHDPRTMPRKYLDMYDPDEIDLPPNYMPVHPFDNGELGIRDELLAGFPRTEAEVRRHIAEYYAMITHVDDAIGRVLDALDKAGKTEDTIVVFAGDNGLAVGQHGLMGKQNMYEHSVRVPLIFAGPGVPAGERRDSFCYLLDIYPTLCELTGLDVPGSVEGKSLLPAMREDAAVRQTLHFAYMDRMRAVRDQRYKLIEYVVDGHRHTQLFDVEADPWELNDLSGDPDYAEHVKRLRGELRKWQTDYADDQPGQGETFWAGFDGQ